MTTPDDEIGGEYAAVPPVSDEERERVRAELLPETDAYADGVPETDAYVDDLPVEEV